MYGAHFDSLDICLTRRSAASCVGVAGNTVLLFRLSPHMELSHTPAGADPKSSAHPTGADIATSPLCMACRAYSQRMRHAAGFPHASSVGHAVSTRKVHSNCTWLLLLYM